MHVANLARLILTLSLGFTIANAQLYGSDSRATNASASSGLLQSTGIASAATKLIPSSLAPTNVLPVASRLPTTTPVTINESVSKPAVSEQTLGIILGAVVGGAAILILIGILACALRQSPSRQYTRTPSPIGEEVTSGSVRAITVRRLFSSRSANAPEVLLTRASNGFDGPRRLSHSRKPSSLLFHSNSVRATGPALTEINESPQLTPLNISYHSISSETPRHSAEPRASRISLSRYHSRSVDLIDAASRYSMDAASDHRRSSVYSPERQSGTEPMPTSPSPAAITPLSPPARNPFFEITDSESPLIPAKNPLRRQSAQVHYPSWNEVQDFSFDERRRSRPVLERRSDSWRPGGDRASGRYELA